VFAVSVLVSVGLSIPCVNVLGAAGEEVCGRCVNTGYLRCGALSCSALQNGLVGIMSPLL
jgi:hypothetical protein